MAATTTTAAAILRTQYTKDRVYWLAYENNPFVGTIDRHEDFGGDYYMVPVQTETPQGGSAGGFTTAQATEAASTFKRFQLTRKNDYAVARIDGEAWMAAQSNTYALVELFTREVDGAIHTNKRSLAISGFRSGTGSRGQISSGSNVSTSSITLNLTSDITNFALGMSIQLAATDGGTLRNSGANAVITKIDRLNGVLAFGDVLTNYIAAAAANDFIVRTGDNNNVMIGMSGWVPGANVTNTLFNFLDRTADPLRLAGQFYNAQGQSIRATLIESIARIDVEGGDADIVWMHPRDKSILVQEMEGKSLYFKEVQTPVPESDQTIGYKTIEADFDGHTVKVMGDLNVPRQHMYIGEWDTMSMYTLGQAPQIIDYDDLEALRVYNADSFEIRIVSRGDFGCKAPGYWVHAINVGL